MARRHGEARPRGGAEAEQRGVEPGHQAGPVGKIALDDSRQDDADDPDRRRGDHRAEKEQRQATEAAHAEAERQDEERGQHAGIRPDAPHQHGREAAEHPEAQDRHGDEGPGERTREAGLGADARQERADARQGGPQVEGHQHQPEADQDRVEPRPPRPRGSDVRLPFDGPHGRPPLARDAR